MAKTKTMRLLLLYIQMIYFHTIQSKQIETNITSNTIVCNDPISCKLLCTNNKCNNRNYNCINTPICDVQCSGNNCDHLTLNIHSDTMKTMKTKSTISCDQCPNSPMRIQPTLNHYSHIINCNKICQASTNVQFRSNIQTNYRSRRILHDHKTTVSAEWTNNFLSILVTFKKLDTNIYSDIFDDCSQIFDDINLQLIGSDSKCVWNEKNKIKLELLIDLSSEATITLDSTLQIWDFIVDSIAVKGSKKTPDIILGYETTEIGVCDDLILDARSTTGLGGREGEFTWKVINMNDNTETIYNGNYVVIDSELLQAAVTYTIQLNVKNWYGESAYIDYNVYKSDIVSPTVTLHGINEYVPNHLNSNIKIESAITFQSECIQQTNTIDSVPVYDITWTVNMQKISANDVAVDMKKYNLLRNLLKKDFDNMEVLVIDADTYLQSGFIYDFNMNLKCIGEYQCDIDATHSITYAYVEPTIECGIFGGDIVLDNVNPNVLGDININLNGDILTYDPNDIHGNNKYEYSWDCINSDTGEFCDEIFDGSGVNGVQNIDLSALNEIDYGVSYSYAITMTVSDCSDSVSLNINTADERILTSETISLFVTATAISDRINVNGELRILTEILTDFDSENVILEYNWVEVNNLLSAEELKKYQKQNLILDGSNLLSQKTYSFQMNVIARNALTDVIIGGGISNIVSVYVNEPARITSGSFVVTHSCSNLFDNVWEAFSERFAVTVSADSVNTPLVYQFGYEIDDNYYYLHDGLLSEGSMNDVYLPIGDFNMFVNVYDSKSAMVTETMECSTKVDSLTECIEFTKLLELDKIQSPSAARKYILPRTQFFLHYLFVYNGNEECVGEQLKNILDIIYEYFVTEDDDNCNSNDIIQLTQIMKDLLLLINEENINMYTDDTIYDKIEDLIFIIFDPCSYVMDKIGTLKDLIVSKESIVAQRPIIMHENTDISQYLPPIISDKRYHSLLFDTVSSIIPLIESVSVTNAQYIYKLLSSSIYIAQLIDLSISISGENNFETFDLFSMYSARVSGEDININMQNVNIKIPNAVTITANDNNNSPFDSTDILITLYDILTEDNVAVNIDKHKFAGLLSEKSVSITLLSKAIDTSNLPSNIEFTFSCDEMNGCDESTQCVWYDEINHIWDNEGCNKIINDAENEITCSCSHLTTFAVIYNMHQEDESGERNIFVNNASTELDIYIHWILASIFLIILFYIVYLLYPFFVHRNGLNWKHRAVFVMILVGITSFLYFLICVFYLFFTQISVQLMSLLLLLPHMSYLLIFSVLFYTWFTLAHSFNINIEDIRKKLRYCLIAMNVFIILIFFVYYVLVLYNINHIIFRIASVLWSILITIITIIITIYAIISVKVLYKTTKKSVTKQRFATEDWKVVRRLIIINSFIACYFIFESIITIYYSININNTNELMSHKLIELILNVFCLICICQMYKNSIKRLIDVNQFIITKRKYDRNQRRSIKSYVTNGTNTNGTVPRLDRAISNTNNTKNSNLTMPTPETSTNQTPETSINNNSANNTTNNNNIRQSVRMSTICNDLSVIKEEDMIEGIDKINVNLSNDNYPDPSIPPHRTPSNNNNSTVIAADIIMSEMSMQSQRDSSLIRPSNVKEKQLKTFQFYYNLREKLNLKKNKRECQNNIGHEGNQSSNVGTIEDAMYEYTKSKSIKL